MRRLFLLTFLLLFTVSFAFSADFGLLVDQKIEAENELFTYTPGFTPWFSWNNGQGISVYLSALLSFKYYDGDSVVNSGWSKPGLIPELSRFALSYRINREMSLEAGRIAYTDVLDFTASGLFDGVRFDMVLPQGNLSAGAYYTGLLYKETAKIIMTGEDAIDYVTPWDYDNFGDYFASRRALAAVRWDMPLGDGYALSAEVLAQFDLTGNDELYNSQYGAVRIDFYPQSMMRISAGALFQTMQNDNGDFGLAFGAMGKLKMELPTPLDDWLGVTVKFTSASTNNAFDAYTPVSSHPQGSVFAGTLAGLALIGADYSVKIINTLSAQCELRYFMQTYDNDLYKDKLLGCEVWASLAWQPLEDIRATLGAGAFFPGLGNAYPSGTDVMWKIIAGVTLSF